MRISKIRIKNFRGYKGASEVEIGNLTTIVGKNDIGKSSVLEALDIFFNKKNAIVKIDKDDVNKDCLSEGDLITEIAVIFDELPASIVIDSSNETSLENEFLLNSEERLEIIKRYNNGGSEKVYIKANHPSNTNCNDLLLRTQKQLQTMIGESDIECENRTVNATMRNAIWEHYSESLELAEIEIDVTKGDTKSIYEKLEGYLPLYTLFQSDRKNSDGDSEVQDPLNKAVDQILADEEIQRSLERVAENVERKLKEVADLTVDKLSEMNPEVAESLNPIIPPSGSLKWKDVFKKVSISGDEDIPINKRGSGVKRLILLNFFRAEAERRQNDKSIPSIVYAIEEPETSQHTFHQKILIRALLALSQADNTQVLLTTHSPIIVKELNFENLRLIVFEDGGKVVKSVESGQLPYPSLNEVNFSAFNEITEEYHNELYGYIESEGHFDSFRTGRQTMEYIRERRNGTTVSEQKILTEYVRHQIHHPENTRNSRFTELHLESSIRTMRSYIENEM
ncbi:ATP-binding protein [Flagellimonas sp.]|uniref:ATP-binding protein n=1 Tax=Flagellimonas sp. TaxID=2058762 RepID=UPI003BA9565A